MYSHEDVYESTNYYKIGLVVSYRFLIRFRVVLLKAFLFFKFELSIVLPRSVFPIIDLEARSLQTSRRSTVPPFQTGNVLRTKHKSLNSQQSAGDPQPASDVTDSADAQDVAVDDTGSGSDDAPAPNEMASDASPVPGRTGLENRKTDSDPPWLWSTR